jgi:hypothetical protein
MEDYLFKKLKWNERVPEPEQDNLAVCDLCGQKTESYIIHTNKVGKLDIRELVCESCQEELIAEGIL